MRRGDTPFRKPRQRRLAMTSRASARWRYPAVLRAVPPSVARDLPDRNRPWQWAAVAPSCSASLKLLLPTIHPRGCSKISMKWAAVTIGCFFIRWGPRLLPFFAVPR
ncbi:hypothetical protein NL676_034229 [Syzygium grande]|nr:hypothetical protein NL676_034229 [Syzygium grande]